MARMLPDVDPSQIQHTSEEPVYVALRHQLGDDYVVLHSYPWLRPWRGEALVEGEADFVVLHPSRGLLVLEVKGGETIQHDGYRWFRATQRRAARVPGSIQAGAAQHARAPGHRERAIGRADTEARLCTRVRGCLPSPGLRGLTATARRQGHRHLAAQPPLHGAGDRDRVRGMDR